MNWGSLPGYRTRILSSYAAAKQLASGGLRVRHGRCFLYLPYLRYLCPESPSPNLALNPSKGVSSHFKEAHASCIFFHFGSTIAVCRQGMRCIYSPFPGQAWGPKHAAAEASSIICSALCRNIIEGISSLLRLLLKQGPCFHLFQSITMDLLRVGIPLNHLPATMVCNCILPTKPYADIFELQDPLRI